MSNLLAKATIEFIDDNGRLWRLHLSSFNVLARGMYEQLYLQAARDWYIAAIDMLPENVVGDHRKRMEKKEQATREQLYHFWLAERSYGWAMALASLQRVEVQVSPVVEPKRKIKVVVSEDGTETEVEAEDPDAPPVPPPTMADMEIPNEWKTPDGMMEAMTSELYDEITFQAYKLNPQVLMPQTDAEKKRGVIRVR